MQKFHDSITFYHPPLVLHKKLLQAKYLDLNMYYKSMEQQHQVHGFKAFENEISML
jgi:hypothetical protein